jgi:hypothetical protein
MARISAVKRRNAWRRAIREVGVLFVAFGLSNFAFTIFKGKIEEPLPVLQAIFLAIFLNVTGLLAINYSIQTEEEETGEEATAETFGEIVEPQKGGGVESLGSMGRRLKDLIGETLAELRSRYPAKEIRKALVHFGHPRRHLRARPPSIISNIASRHDHPNRKSLT